MDSGIMLIDLKEAHLTYGEWKICFYLDLNIFYKEGNKLQMLLNNMTQICNKNILVLEEDNDELCAISLKQMQNQITIMRDKEATITSFENYMRRNRRAPTRCTN